MNLELETYTPSEAEAITGVSQMSVRNWRRAGYLPRHRGHARYTIADLLTLTSMQALISRGIQPGAALPYASETARAIFQTLIWSKEAYAEAALSAGRQDLDREFVEQISNSGISADLIRSTLSDMIDGNAVKELAEEAEKLSGLSGQKRPNWLIIWANDEMEFYYDEDNFEDRFFGETSYGCEFTQGPVILFSLGSMAQMVLKRLPRPPIKLAEKE